MEVKVRENRAASNHVPAACASLSLVCSSPAHSAASAHTAAALFCRSGFTPDQTTAASPLQPRHMSVLSQPSACVSFCIRAPAGVPWSRARTENAPPLAQPPWSSRAGETLIIIIIIHLGRSILTGCGGPVLLLLLLVVVAAPRRCPLPPSRTARTRSCRITIRRCRDGAGAEAETDPLTLQYVEDGGLRGADPP